MGDLAQNGQFSPKLQIGPGFRIGYSEKPKISLVVVPF